MKVLLQRKLSLVFLIIQFLISAVFCGVALYVEFIPTKYIVALIIVCLVLLGYQILSQLTNSSYIIGRVLCVFFCAFFIGGGYYIMMPMRRWKTLAAWRQSWMSFPFMY